MASSIPVAVSNLKRLIWNTQKAWLSKNLVFMHSHKLLLVSEHKITSNLLLLKKPPSLQPFTFSLFLCLPLTESVSSPPLRSHVSTKTTVGERESKGEGGERDTTPVRQKASLHCWIFTIFPMSKFLWLWSFCKNNQNKIIGNKEKQK